MNMMIIVIIFNYVFVTLPPYLIYIHAYVMILFLSFFFINLKKKFNFSQNQCVSLTFSVLKIKRINQLKWDM